MTLRVRVLPSAEDDLFEIYAYVAEQDSPDKAFDLLVRLEERVTSLENFASRGRVPPELRKIGVLDYREIRFKPYRIFYRVVSSEVFVYAVLDGRRDLAEVLSRRLLR